MCLSVGIYLPRSCDSLTPWIASLWGGGGADTQRDGLTLLPNMYESVNKVIKLCNFYIKYVRFGQSWTQFFNPVSMKYLKCLSSHNQTFLDILSDVATHRTKYFPGSWVDRFLHQDCRTVQLMPVPWKSCRLNFHWMMEGKGLTSKKFMRILQSVPFWIYLFFPCLVLQISWLSVTA